MSNQKELIFSIYPKINTTSNNNIFNIQTIHKSGYYPTELEYLVNKIHFANTNLEVEENTREYHDFINKRKLELLEMFKWIKKCENLNQRELFLLINNHHILHNEQNEIIYIGGPLGGGYLKLDHTLDEMENEHWYSFLSLDEKGIGKEIPSVNTEKEYNNAILDNSLGDLLNISNFPIIIDSLEFSIIPALRYFEKEYERISIINDFAPLVDSALTAARSIINQNYLYFQEIPSILKQRLVQYKINQDTHIPDFLGLQKLIIESSKQNNFKLKILGYSFNSGTKSFSLVVDELFSNYTILLIVEDEFTKSLKFVEEIKQELELKREIIAFENDFRNKSDLTKTNVKYSSNLVWFNSYKSLISKINKTQSKQTFQYPIGFIDIKIGDDGNVHYNHSFNENEFPIEYTSILDHFKNALELIVTGPLDLFNFKVDNISVHLADNCNRYVLTNYLAKKDENRTTFIISYEIQSIQELNLIFLKRNRDLTSDEQNIELLCKNEYNKIKINLAQIAEKPENIIPFIELNEIISNPKPLSLYSKKILSSNVVPVLLKRIIIEIEQWEDQQINQISIDDILIKYYKNDENYQSNHSIMKNINEQLSDLDKYINERLKDEELIENYSTQILKLEQDLNEFNPTLFNFILGSIQRENPIKSKDYRYLFHHIKEIFEDIKIAVVDFGLYPEQWATAESIQLYDAYQSQINWVKQSLIMKLREIIEDDYDGSDLDMLINHKLIAQQSYISFKGSIKGYQYIPLKKSYLLIKSKKNLLQNKEKIMNLSDLLHQLDSIKISNSNLKLPELPKNY